MRSRVPSYRATHSIGNDFVCPTHVNVSPTRLPAGSPDAAFWPAWTDMPIERLGFVVATVGTTPMLKGGF